MLRVEKEVVQADLELWSGLKCMLDDAGRREEEGRKREKEIRRREEEARRRDEVRRREEVENSKGGEGIRREDEDKRKEEEDRRREEEGKRKEEEVKRREEDRKRKREVARLLEDFLTTSKVGCFESRLKMFDILLKSGSLHPTTTRLLSQILNYHAYYLEDFKDYHKRLVSSFEEEINECTELAGWKSKNYLVLKDTVDKYHRKIHSVLKRYRESLEVGLEGFLFAPLRKSLEAEDMNGFLERTVGHFKKNENNRKKMKKIKVYLNYVMFFLLFI